MLIITIIALLLCVLSMLIVLRLKFRYRTLEQQTETLNKIKQNIIAANSTLEEHQAKQTNLIEDISQSTNELQVLTAQKVAAVELAEKQLELEYQRRITAFETKLNNEITLMELNSKKPLLEKELDEINTQIATARKTLIVQQEQAQQAIKEEDFINFHSISLTPQDFKDIELIREFSPRLTRQEAFFKLIWTEFYQKPIQSLCKTLNVEKVCGVYKITNTKIQRMYIGQALDVAARWKEHCKCGLGIGSTSYMTNKFYKVLHEEGIENFTFEILEICTGDQLNDREVYWINFYNATTFGYNSKIGG